MHTKKTNNTNKLIQISYHSILTKIQKLQNLKKKKKKKTFFCTGQYARYCLKLAGTGQYCLKLAGTASIFSGTKQGVICTGLLAGTVYTSRTDQYDTESTPLLLRQLQHATPSLKMNRYRN